MPALLLHPLDPAWIPADPDALLATLRESGLVGAPLPELAADALGAGERFLQQIMFLGCSPQVRLDPGQPGAGQAVCHLRLLSYPATTFLSDTPPPAARCPACRAPAAVTADCPGEEHYACPGCGAQSPLARLDWRRGAGYGRCFIEVCGIYPHEAVPSDELLATLAGFSGGAWDYFYRR